MSYTPVTRADLKGFDRAATDLILAAQEKGCRVRISNRNHAILLTPDGVRTTAVPRKMKSGQRTSKNTYAAVARLFKKEG